jgi:hypothetical protein
MDFSKSQASIDADKEIGENLFRVAKDDLVHACYIAKNPIKKGEEIVLGEAPASVCLKSSDGSRIAYIEIRNGRVVVSEIFTLKQLENARSVLLNPKGKNNGPKK